MWNQDDFLKEVKDEFLGALNYHVELLDKWFNEGEQAWNADDIQAGTEGLEEMWDDALASVVAIKAVAMGTSGCWDLCKEVIGNGDIKDYTNRKHPLIDIQDMTEALLDQLARERHDWHDLFRNWVARLAPPDKTDAGLCQGMEGIICDRCGKPAHFEVAGGNCTTCGDNLCDQCANGWDEFGECAQCCVANSLFICIFRHIHTYNYSIEYGANLAEAVLRDFHCSCVSHLGLHHDCQKFYIVFDSEADGTSGNSFAGMVQKFLDEKHATEVDCSGTHTTVFIRKQGGWFGYALDEYNKNPDDAEPIMVVRKEKHVKN